MAFSTLISFTFKSWRTYNNYMSKFAKILLLFVLTLAIGVNATSTTCGLVNVDYNDALTLNTGQTGSFTVTVFNQGTTTQRISASAQCNPLELQCSFSGISDNTLLAPGEQKSFSLDIEATGASGTFSIPGEFRAGPSSATCTASLTFTANVLHPQSGTVQPLTVWITPTETQNARPSDEVEFTIGLKNNLNKKIFAGISTQNTNPFKTSTTLSASNVALEAGETKYVNVKVTLPPGTAGGTYSWIYHVDAGNCCNYDLDLPVSITVEAPRLTLQLLNAPVQDVCTIVNAGDSTSIPFSLKNNGEITGPFDLAIEGSTTVKNIATVTEPRLTLLSGEQKQFEVRISPTARTPIDNYTYKLRGTYQGFVFLDRSFCFTVKAVEEATVSAPSNIAIERMRLSNTMINVTNTGTTSNEYALSIVPTSELSVQIQPGSFTLAPGATQSVALAFTSTLSTPLGPTIVTLRLDAPRYSKNIDLNATVYATGRTGESIFRVTAEREFPVARGVAKGFNVTVENVGANALRDVSLTLEGIPTEWYTNETRTILAGGSEVFTVIIAVPLNTSETQLEASLVVRSGEEFLSTPVTLTVSNVVFDFVIDEVIENRNSAGETTSVDLLVTLRNDGATDATQIAPLINDLNYIYVQTPPSITLGPGQSAQVRINLKPAGQGTANQTVALQFAASEGVTNTRQVTIPALTVASPNLTMKIAVILILLIAIVAVLAKTQNKF